MYANIDKSIFSNVIKSVRPTYGNKEELATLKQISVIPVRNSHLTISMVFILGFPKFFLGGLANLPN